MYDSDREYLSRFALDPETEYGFEDLYGSDLSYESYEEPINPSDDESPVDSEDVILEDDFLFEK